MNCAEFDNLLCDYVDQTLHGEQKSACAQHIAECAECAELAKDCLAAAGFLERVAAVEPPPELVTRILFDVTSGRATAQFKQSPVRRLFGRWLEPILQPRFAMGMAMTVLSFAMLGRFSGIQVRQLKPSDLDPVKVWGALDDKAHRTWERGVKYYESLKLVYDIQTRLKDWGDQAEADRNAAKNQPGSGTQK
ncbi:MAG: hypothetical protein ABI823_04120 [Bryobacteraceae bacterium]